MSPIYTDLKKMWGPPVMERWFIKPMNTIVIGIINHGEIGVMCTNLAVVWGPHLAIYGNIMGIYPTIDGDIMGISWLVGSFENPLEIMGNHRKMWENSDIMVNGLLFPKIWYFHRF